MRHEPFVHRPFGVTSDMSHHLVFCVLEPGGDVSTEQQFDSMTEST